MKVREKIILSVHHYGPVGSRLICPRVHDEPYELLLKNLNAASILIDSKLSEKTIKYYIGNSLRELTVPVETTMPIYSKENLQSYSLKDGNGLELTLENWEEITGRPPRGVFGGTLSGDFGVIGKLLFSGDDLTIIQNVKKALEETYMKKFR